MAKKAQVQIELEEGGRILTPFSQLVIEQHFDWHHSFELRMAMHAFTGNSQSFAETSEKIIGKPLKVGLTSLTDKQAEDNFFKGIITDIGMSRSHGTTNEVVIKGYSPTILLEDGPNTRTFFEMDMGQLVSQVLSPYPSNVIKQQIGSSSDVMPYIVQYRESNYNFLCRMAKRHGEWFFYDGTTLHFEQPSGTKVANLLLGKDLTNFQLGLKLEPPNFRFKTHDYLKNENYETSSSSSNVSGLNSFGQFLLKASEDVFNQESLHVPDVYVEDAGKLKTLVDIRKSVHANNMVKLSGQSDNIGVRIGATVDISASFGDILNKEQEEHKSYLVTQITHLIDGHGNYQNQFQAIPASATYSPPYSHVVHPSAEIQTAVVKETHDPEKLGRVKVQFYWQDGSDVSPWIRYNHAHAGPSNGFFFIPEIEDEVLVGFEANNPERPTVLGSLYHNDSPADDSWQDPDNKIKAIKTKSGNEIKFTDKSGSEEITIFNPDKKNEITLSLSGDGSITIKSQGNINISAEKSMALSANDITIDAKKEIAVNCENLSVNSKQNTSFDAGQNFDIKSKQATSLEATTDFSVSALNAKIDAKVNMEVGGTNTTLKANANLDAKANAMMNLNGTAMVNIQGTMIKLN